jgi:hypothetical protein
MALFKIPLKPLAEIPFEIFGAAHAYSQIQTVLIKLILIRFRY